MNHDWSTAAASVCLCLFPLLTDADDAAGKACALLTQAEIETALGTTLPKLTPSGPFCMAKGSTVSVTVRLAKQTGAPGNEEKGLEMMKQMGVQVEVKKFGPITCSTLTPPANLAAQFGFNTTCSVIKQGTVAAIEVAAPSRQNMAPIEKLRPLAEKMAGRL